MSIKDSQDLKGLETRLAKAVSDKASNLTEIDDLRVIDRRIDGQIGSILGSIHNIKERTKDVVVSEHAMLRYVERCMGFDLAQIRNEILTDTLKAQIKAMGNGKYPVAEGCKAIVKNNTIITIS